MKSMEIEKLLLDTAWDAIYYGEYFFENFGSKKKGIEKITDSNPPGSVFAQYEGSNPKFFFRLNKSTNMMSTSQDWHIG